MTTYAKYVPLDRIPLGDVLKMHGIFERYYLNGPLETFLKDLSRKSGAFVIRRRQDDAIVGFSTLGIYDIELDGRPMRCLFSGDTVIERQYWGSRALQSAFALRLIIEILKRPLQGVHWLLISKGYKTYLLMSRNFDEFHPKAQPHARAPRMEKLARAYCEELFPGRLDQESGLLKFGDDANRLKSGVADISEDLQEIEPDVAFFNARNPTWQQGTELPCIARVDLMSIFRLLPRYVLKALGLRRADPAHAASAVTASTRSRA